MNLLLGKIKYDEFKWKLRDDLAVVALLLGMQLGYTKYCRFLFEGDSRDKNNHYVSKLWPKRLSLERFLEILYVSIEHSLRFGLDLLNRFKPASFDLQFYFWAGVDSDLVLCQK
jgi:hypothetical protein